MSKSVYDQTNGFVVYKSDNDGNYYGAESGQIGPWTLVNWSCEMASYEYLSPIDKSKVAKLWLQYIRVPSLKKQDIVLEQWRKRLRIVTEYDPDPRAKAMAQKCLDDLVDPAKEKIQEIRKLLGRRKKLDKCYIPRNGLCRFLLDTENLNRLDKPMV